MRWTMFTSVPDFIVVIIKEEVIFSFQLLGG